MTIRIALHHKTTYTYDRLVTLSPHVIRLRPAPHCRTPILSYSLKIEPAEGGAKPVRESPDGPLEFEIHPGQTIELKVKVERNGHVGNVPLGNEGAGRNLPFGVIVDNIGLNGLLITEKQDERTFFLTADKSVPPQTRPFHLTTTAAGGQSSPPVILHVR